MLQQGRHQHQVATCLPDAGLLADKSAFTMACTACSPSGVSSRCASVTMTAAWSDSQMSRSIVRYCSDLHKRFSARPDFPAMQGWRQTTCRAVTQMGDHVSISSIVLDMRHSQHK